ncbi:MAG: DUF6261 family protein [Tannerellaceae bacterium]|nr:DUF6261 family protein [Tannerellaceae bacterium]
MRQIEVNYMGKFRNGEHGELHLSITANLKKVITPSSVLMPLCSVYYTWVDMEDRVSKKARKFNETRQVNDMSMKRYKSYKILDLSVESLLLSDDPEIEDHAQTIKNILDKYENASKKPSVESISDIRDLIQDLQNPPCNAYIQSLGLTEKVEILSANNIAFKKIYDIRAKEQHVRKNQAKMPQIRRKVDQAFYKVMDAINTNYTTNELGDKDPSVRTFYNDLIDDINSDIEKIESVYSRRSKSKKSKKSKKRENDELEIGDIVVGEETNKTPNFEMTDQTLIGQSTVVEGCAAQMTITAVYPAIFILALYPTATNGVVRLKDANGAWTDFPIAGFLMKDNDMNPIGLILNPPTPGTAFAIPLNTLKPQPAEITLDGKLLATLDGIGYPDTVTAD